MSSIIRSETAQRMGRSGAISGRCPKTARTSTNDQETGYKVRIEEFLSKVPVNQELRQENVKPMLGARRWYSLCFSRVSLGRQVERSEAFRTFSGSSHRLETAQELFLFMNVFGSRISHLL